ncbi:hypothetical protein AAIB41_02640 [Brucella sp. BE17]|uniref:hypothetical protein n=1 Tax=Brucella sp. BE17 TaxID=3142977 RepID=UPI0031BA4078
MTTTHSYIASVDRFEKEGSLVVWLSEEGQKALNSDRYEINSSCGCATVVWDDNDNGYQEVQHSPGGTEDARVLAYMLKNPESAIEDIESRLEDLKDEAAHKVTDIRRDFVDGTAALVFNLGGEKSCEWLEVDDHNSLTSSDSHLGCNHSYLNLDVIKDALNSWLAENPVKIEWSENKGFHGGFMDGGSYDTLAEAQAALESVRAEMLSQCSDDEDRKNFEEGELKILW